MNNRNLTLCVTLDNKLFINCRIANIKFRLSNNRYIDIAAFGTNNRILNDTVEITTTLALTGVTYDVAKNTSEQKTPVEPVISLNQIIGIEKIELLVPNHTENEPVAVKSMEIKIPNLFDGDNNIISIPHDICSSANIHKTIA